MHVDAYRLTGAEELKNIGLAEYLGRADTIVLIEWADRVREILPVNAVLISIKETGEAAGRILEIS